MNEVRRSGRERKQPKSIYIIEEKSYLIIIFYHNNIQFYILKIDFIILIIFRDNIDLDNDSENDENYNFQNKKQKTTSKINFKKNQRRTSHLNVVKENKNEDDIDNNR